MVGDYISTSIVPGDSDATPVFMVAFPPTGSTSCGLPPIVCHENTYTTTEDALLITGGTNAANDVAPSSPTKKSGLSAPATAF